jgi:hypothetical protein
MTDPADTFARLTGRLRDLEPQLPADERDLLRRIVDTGSTALGLAPHTTAAAPGALGMFDEADAEADEEEGERRTDADSTHEPQPGKIGSLPPAPRD